MAGHRILFAGGGTGGHLYPALNIAAALERLEPETRCMFVGAQRGIEARVLPGRRYPFRLLPLHPIYRQRPWRNLRTLASLPAVFGGLRSIFRSFDPELVVGTGGYVAGPTLAYANRRGIPIALQEQNAQPGFTTRRLAPRADQLHLGYPEARDRLRVSSGTDVFAYGNPVAVPAPGGTDGFDWPEGRILLVVGGSQGARGLNRALARDLERTRPEDWPDGVSVVWVAGRDHAAEVAAGVRDLPVADRVRVVPFIEGLGGQLDRVALALSRSGAMLVAELCAAGCPAVYVPLPTAAAGHQTANARALVEVGAAEMREQADLAPGEIWDLCRSLLADEERLASMARAAAARAHPDAAQDIARALLDLLDRRPAEGA